MSLAHTECAIDGTASQKERALSLASHCESAHQVTFFFHERVCAGQNTGLELGTEAGGGRRGQEHTRGDGGTWETDLAYSVLMGQGSCRRRGDRNMVGG